ncbi:MULTISPECIES: hypothetical protein [Pseudomonas]|uniref:Uncharacterized protein n=1 Tax=Pseudomonas azadiae TaxID=2843612 RepID=A0ABS6NTV1_9PSED|nr:MULTISPECIES: hypothetical protein [Pseudomonas]MBV4451638.1 hypothetical protein [Pseudomonas azadiae]NMF42557.1 hypothetical protein [Pseudomonas sp. SWRI 103]
MSNVSTKPFAPMNAEYAKPHQPSVPVNKPLEVSSSASSVSEFLQHTGRAAEENTVTVNKETMERLFAMFEYAVKAMRSMLAGMGVLPKLPGEQIAQAQSKLGADSKVVSHANAKPHIEPQTDAKPQVKPGPDVKVRPFGRTQLATGPDGQLSARPATPPLAESAQTNKPSADINVSVQVQNCHCPQTGEKVAREPALTPRIDAPSSSPVAVTTQIDNPPSPQSTANPKRDDTPSPQPHVTPATVDKAEPKPPAERDATTLTPVEPQPETPTTPDLTSPAPDDLEDAPVRHSRRRPDEHRTAARPSLRSRY